MEDTENLVSGCSRQPRCARDRLRLLGLIVATGDSATCQGRGRRSGTGMRRLGLVFWLFRVKSLKHLAASFLQKFSPTLRNFMDNSFPFNRILAIRPGRSWPRTR